MTASAPPKILLRYIPAFKGIVLGQRFDKPAAMGETRVSPDEAWTAWPDSRQGYARSYTASWAELEARAVADLLAQPAGGS